VISHGEIARRLSVGESLPERGAALSVDDAFTSFGEVAMPLLRQARFPVTLFVNTDSVGTPGYLDWKQLQDLSTEGVEIANHTATHDYLVELRPGENPEQWRVRVREDILKAQEEFARHLGFRPKIFAYPYGEYVPELLEIVAELGFQAAFGQQSGVISAGQNRYLLPRFPMGGPFATLEGFRSKLAMQPLMVAEERPLSPLIEVQNPPELLVRIEDASADLRLINCFAQGDNNCTAVPIEGRQNWYRVTAEKPLSGRRNKYTLTAQGKGGWYWYSHLWLKADRPVPAGGSGTQPQAGVGKTGQAVLPNQ